MSAKSKRNLHEVLYDGIDSYCRVIIFGMRHSEWCHGVLGWNVLSLIEKRGVEVVNMEMKPTFFILLSSFDSIMLRPTSSEAMIEHLCFDDKAWFLVRLLDRPLSSPSLSAF
jgi:hypothetical protein